MNKGSQLITWEAKVVKIGPRGFLMPPKDYSKSMSQSGGQESVYYRLSYCRLCATKWSLLWNFKLQVHIYTLYKVT